MRVHRLEQLAVHCADLEATARLLREALGMPFGRPRTAGVAGDRLRVLGSPTGLVLVDAVPTRTEGLRAAGFRVEGMDEISARLAARGHDPALTIDVGRYQERQYEIAGVRFSFAEYDGEDRLSGAAAAGILEPEDPAADA